MLLTKRSTFGQTVAANCSAVCSVFGLATSRTWRELANGSYLGGRGPALAGKSVLIALTDQLTTAALLIELDGVAARIVLYPPDLQTEHLAYAIQIGEIQALISDRVPPETEIEGLLPIVPGEFADSEQAPSEPLETEWVLLTSGTTGLPKLVAHTLETLSGAIQPMPAKNIVWSTFYDIRRYGGLQIFLRAALTGCPLVLSDSQESTADFLARANVLQVTHISGTPTQWRRVVMSPAARSFQPEYIRLSGEISDQSILDQLRNLYPEARISHAFASTEAGVAFEVKDGQSGFPESTIRQTPGVEMKVEDGSLRIRSSRNALRYLNADARPLKDSSGYVDTGDTLQLKNERYFFAGRRDGVINVGGLKVHPEEVEEVINRHPEVQMSLVHTKKSAIMGALVVADVVLNTTADPSTAKQAILSLCRESLDAHKVPVIINFVSALNMSETGKLIRHA